MNYDIENETLKNKAFIETIGKENINVIGNSTKTWGPASTTIEVDYRGVLEKYLETKDKKYLMVFMENDGTIAEAEEYVSYRIGDSKRRIKGKLVWHNNQNSKSIYGYRADADVVAKREALMIIDKVICQYVRIIEQNNRRGEFIKILNLHLADLSEENTIKVDWDDGRISKSNYIGKIMGWQPINSHGQISEGNIVRLSDRIYIFEIGKNFDPLTWKLMKGSQHRHIYGTIDEIIDKADALDKDADDFINKHSLHTNQHQYRNTNLTSIQWTEQNWQMAANGIDIIEMFKEMTERLRPQFEKMVEERKAQINELIEILRK